MKRPAFQFYPADWRKDTELQSCSIAARGLWHELLCVMHECTPYGHLTVNGTGATEAQAARLAGVSLTEYRKLMHELEKAAVMSRTAQGIMYSRRMVKDEHIRSVRAAAGKQGGNPNLLNLPPGDLLNQGNKQSPTPSSSSSASANGVVIEPESRARTDQTMRANSPPRLPLNWWKTSEGIDHAAKILGISGHPGQGHKELKQRVFNRIAEMKRAA